MAKLKGKNRCAEWWHLTGDRDAIEDAEVLTLLEQSKRGSHPSGSIQPHGKLRLPIRGHKIIPQEVIL